MFNKIKLVNHSWYNTFSCIGGPCPMNCCRPKMWDIYLSDKELERFKNLDHPFREEILKAINFDKKTFKTKGELCGCDTENPDRCALQTDEGWCSIVLNCGEEMLSEVCTVYPRDTIEINNWRFQLVDVSCPEVAEYLFKEEPMTNTFSEIASPAGKRNIDEKAFDAVMDLQQFLIDLFLSVEGFRAGKCYILFDAVNMLQEHFQSGKVSKAGLEDIIKKYNSEDMLISILSECEAFDIDKKQKAGMAKVAILLLHDVLTQIPLIVEGRLDNLGEDIEAWKDVACLEEDLTEFYKYRDAHFPQFIDRYMAYRIFTTMLTTNYKKVAMKVKAGYITILLNEIAAMSYWKAHRKEISASEYSFLISSIERRIYHSKENESLLMGNAKAFEEQLNFSLFLLPVY